MGNTHSDLRRNFSNRIKDFSIRKKVTLQLDKKSNAKASITTDVKSDSLSSQHDQSIVVSSLPPSTITAIEDTDINPTTLSKTLVINDREYQNTKKYMLPIDDQEQDKLIQEHFLYKLIFGNNFSAPVQDLLSGPYTEQSKRCSAESSYYIIENVLTPRVLDIACGNGTWLLEMAAEYPSSEFYGIDFSSGYPTTIKPPNTFFSNHDILSADGFPFLENYFDYVFMRQVYNCFSESDWTFILKEIKRVVKPGGYVEFRDVDPILRKSGVRSNALFSSYPNLMKQQHEVNVLWARHMYDYLNNVGKMTDMSMQVNQLRFGSSGPIGKTIDTSLRSGFESHRQFFESSYNKEEYDQVIEDIVNESIAHRSFFNYYVCWGRKPLLEYDTNYQSKRLSISSCSTLTRDDVTDKNNHVPSKLSMDSGNFNSLDSDSVSDIDQFIEGFED